MYYLVGLIGSGIKRGKGEKEKRRVLFLSLLSHFSVCFSFSLALIDDDDDDDGAGGAQ